MKVCVTAKGNNLDAEVDPRFGRCRYFIIVNESSMEYEAVENPYAVASGGAGVQAGQLVSEKKVSVVLTGNVGPNAFETLKPAGVEVITGVSGTVRDALEKYKSGDFTPVQGPTVKSKSGLK